ncbi:MAG: hypothetical protein K9L30_03260 [Desulfobacterales bacterium]|nr:hypothetical protein [Desulfobacterales bacterium]
MDKKKQNGLIDALYVSWKKQPEETRKKVFEGIHHADRKLFKKLSKEMNGFSLKGLCSRPPGVINLIDKKLFAAYNGSLATDFMARYFVNVEVSLNDQFLELFRKIALSSPDSSSREITSKTLETIRNGHPDVDLLDLYEAALKIVEPSRFDDKAPEVSEFENEDPDVI